MTRITPRHLVRLAAVTAIVAAVPGCNTLTRLSEVGGSPELTKITNPVARQDYRPVSLPMPAPKVAEDNPNSLWRAGARAFFKDTRAKAVGDILTVKLKLNDKATLDNKSERERDDKEDTDVTTLLGLEAEFAKKLPQAISPASIASFGSKSETKGDGSIARSANIELTFAAVITQILPNGALVIFGRQEIRVNYELRKLMVNRGSSAPRTSNRTIPSATRKSPRCASRTAAMVP